MRKASEDYIFFAKIPRCFERPSAYDWPFQRMPIVGKARPLPPVRTPSASLWKTLRARKSSRRLETGAVSLDALSAVLKYSAGVRSLEPVPRGYAPSAGGLYPVSCFVSTASVPALDPGCYHYDPLEHSLIAYRPPLPGETFSEPEVVSPASVLLLLAVNLHFAAEKYGERALRFALLECGHVAQNACLVSTALGLANLPIGGYRDAEVERHLGLDGRVQHVCYAIGLG